MFACKPQGHGNGLQRVNSRELRGSVLYTDCECNRRNGLQHDCPRHQCAGTRQCCAVEPWPDCELGRYYREKWCRQALLRTKGPPKTLCIPPDFDLAPKYLEDEKKVKPMTKKEKQECFERAVKRCAYTEDVKVNGRTPKRCFELAAMKAAKEAEKVGN
ncbi:hypothetical protein QAD02_004290 [Eretmocerus hayati]|uniref:Uncharacterized protein n=1 Tax=Eretmocerus hayati TaxID=131215 RepID=A0ACC2NP52_9HYME|nr:hypothetical protein QAD02_004290 [Eretmocerus hayati]